MRQALASSAREPGPRVSSAPHPPFMKLAPRYFRASDGTAIAYYVTGPADGEPIVITAGLGGGIGAWSRIIAHLAPHMRVYAWDYRGLYNSERPEDGASFHIAQHAADLHALIEHEQIEHPVLAGWSMGVQVTLELNRHHAELPRGIVALHGSPGKILTTAFDDTWFERMAPTVFEVMRRHSHWMRRPGPWLTSFRPVTNGFMRVSQALRIMDRSCDPEMFQSMARGWVDLDLNAYAEIFDRLGEHDARDMLHTIVAPTLVIGGGADPFTPPYLSEELAERIPDSELLIVPRATHFGPLEYPDEMNARIERFLRERLGVSFR